MRISDWSSDVCSSDLARRRAELHLAEVFQRRDRPLEPAERLGAVRDDLERDHVELQHVLVELLVELAALALLHPCKMAHLVEAGAGAAHGDRKSTRLNSSH